MDEKYRTLLDTFDKLGQVFSGEVENEFYYKDFIAQTNKVDQLVINKEIEATADFHLEITKLKNYAILAFKPKEQFTQGIEKRRKQILQLRK